MLSTPVVTVCHSKHFASIFITTCMDDFSDN